MFLILTVAALAISAAPVDVLTDPLRPATAGQLQCHQPDEQHKTCRSMASYEALGDSRYSTVAVILLSPNGPVTLETTAPVEVKAGAVCGTISREILLAGKVRVADRLLGAEEARPALDTLATAMAPVMNKLICTRYEPSGDSLIAKATIDGKPAPEQRVKWVSPQDGYRVAP